VKLHFDAQQPYKNDAIRAVVDLFEGKPEATGTVVAPRRSIERGAA
jgi:hypothetical protein